jgi:hypothetical protein
MFDAGVIPPGRALVTGVLDACAAGAVALVFWANVGVAGQSDTNPPTCTTANGGSIDCSLEGPLRLAQVGIFLAVLAALVTWQLVRSRRRARAAEAGQAGAPAGV